MLRRATLVLAVLAGVVVSARQPFDFAQGKRDALVPGGFEGLSQRIQQSSLPLHQHTIPLDTGRVIDVTIASAGNAGTIARLTDTTTRAIRVLSAWLGAPTDSKLTVVDLPWGVDAPAASYPGLVATRVRWIEPARDVTAERSLIAALARQFWAAEGTDGTDVTAGDGSFREALTLYTSARAIHRVLEGRNFHAPRFFSGFVPFPMGSLMLSPNQSGAGVPLGEFDEMLLPEQAAWRFAPVAHGSQARRAAGALRTLEHVIGWPAMQQVLWEARVRAATSPISPETLATVVEEQRGISMEWFVRDLVRSSDAIDYAVGSVTSEQDEGAVRTTVRVDRRGRGMFSGTDRPRSDGPARSFAIVVRFADGTEVRAGADGRDPQTQIAIDSQSQAVVVAVDPDHVVLIDENRSNNVWSAAAPRNRLALRLVANWILWLQNVMLTSTAIA